MLGASLLNVGGIYHILHKNAFLKTFFCILSLVSYLGTIVYIPGLVYISEQRFQGC